MLYVVTSMDAKVLFNARRRRTGALQKPNGVLIYSDISSMYVKKVLGLSCLLDGFYQNTAARSRLVKHSVLQNWSPAGSAIFNVYVNGFPEVTKEADFRAMTTALAQSECHTTIVTSISRWHRSLLVFSGMSRFYLLAPSQRWSAIGTKAAACSIRLVPS